jgi:hypothetical protein
MTFRPGANRVRCLFATVLAASTLTLLVQASAGPAPAKAAIVEVQTVPAVKGQRFLHRGRAVRADNRGRVSINVSGDIRNELRVIDTPVSPGVEARLDRFYPGRNIVAIAFYHRVRPNFVDLQGNKVDPAEVDSTVVKGIHGKEYTFRKGEPRWLQVSRVVARRNNRLRPKSLRYTVEKVRIKGANVVNAGQQRFRPSETPRFPVQVLLYAARFKTRDAFFGFPLGSAVRLTFPDGRVERHDLAENGELVLRSLPRSDYEVTVDAPGFSFSRPVSLSRNQSVELEILSYLDIGLSMFVFAAFMVGLPLIRRPELRARLVELIPQQLAARRRARPGGQRP